MPIARRFCLAPAFARLIRRERMAVSIMEGHFADQSERRSFVRIEGDHCILVLEDRGPEGTVEEERSEVSRAQGEVLLDVCAGKVQFERITLETGNDVGIFVDRFTAPVVASYVEVAFPEKSMAETFRAPAWFGAELGGEDVGDPRRIALGAKPKLFEGPIQNAALESLIDLLDHRASRYAAFRGNDDPMMSALRRLVKQPAETREPKRSGAPVPRGGANQVIAVDAADLGVESEVATGRTGTSSASKGANGEAEGSSVVS